MNSNQTTEHELPADASAQSSRPPPLPQEDDGAARDRWRRIRCGLGVMAEDRVGALLKDQLTENQDKAGVDGGVRTLGQIVLMSLRSMEMENNLDAKDGKPADADSAERRRRNRELADEYERQLERYFAARRDGAAGDAKDIRK